MANINSHCVGIDLGSSNSAVSVFEGNEVKIIPNSEGGLYTPSIVAFTKDGVKVGESAKRQAIVNPQNTIFNIKRLMGKTYDQVKHLKRPYKIVNNKGRAAVEVDGKIYSPEEISAMILQKMKKTAEDYLGCEVTKAVITVPAYFNSDERESTKTAGEIAGLQVERIIAEPTSAILNVDSKSAKKYAVYDFGGSTMDLSIVDVGDGVFEVLATDGDLDLGGYLIDEALVDFIASEFKKDNNVDLRKDPMALQRLFEAAEKAKIELSNQSTTEINLPYVTSIDNIPKHLVFNLNKSKFEQICDTIIERTIDIAKSSLKKSKLSIEDIDSVLLVGGSSRIPLAQEKLEKMFGKKLNKSLNPDLCVSTGAGIQGHIINGGESDILLLDVIPISIGIETMGSVFTKMIEANTTIPTKKSQIFSTAADNQPSVEVHILQGERPMASHNKSLGRFFLDGIPPAPRGIPQIEIEMNIDANGILVVEAHDKGTGKKQQMRIEGSSNLTDDEKDRMIREAKENEEADKKEKESIDKLNMADSMVFQTRKQIKELGEKLTDEDKNKLEDVVKKLENDYTNKLVDNIDDHIKEITEVWNEISTRIYSNDSIDSTNSEQDEVVYEDVK